MGLLLAMLLVQNVVIEEIVVRNVSEFFLCYIPEKIYFFPGAILYQSYPHSLSEYKKRPLVSL